MTKPSLLFAGRVFAEPWGGVRELAGGLLHALAGLADQQGRGIEVLVPRPGISPVVGGCVKETVLPQFASNRLLWDHWTLARHANSRKDSVFYNNKLVIPPMLRSRGIISIYDFMYFPQPDRYDWREYLLGDTIYMRRMIAASVRRAVRIHLISRHSLADALRLFPDVPESKYAVIYPGVDAAFWQTREDEARDRLDDWRRGLGIGSEYILYAGGLSRRKNVSLLARAFLRLRQTHPGLQLVVTGGSKATVLDPGFEHVFKGAPKGAIQRLGLISRDRLRYLYQNALYSVFPSLYEGFGFPPVESQAAGCPVIAARASSIPEVVGDSAPLFDPRSENELVARMREMMDPEIRSRFARLGLSNAGRFQWRQAAQDFLAVVDQACG